MKALPEIKGFVYDKNWRWNVYKPPKTQGEKLFFFFNFFTTGIMQLKSPS